MVCLHAMSWGKDELTHMQGICFHKNFGLELGPSVKQWGGNSSLPDFAKISTEMLPLWKELPKLPIYRSTAHGPTPSPA